MAIAVPGCSSHYKQGVREWAQPAQQLLAQRVDEAMAAQDRALTSLQRLPEVRPMDDDGGLYRDQISLHVYRFGQSVQAIRDVQDRNTSAATRNGSVNELTEDLAAVHNMMVQYLAQQTQQNTDALSVVTINQLQQAVRATEDHAQALLTTLQSSQRGT